MTHGGPPDPDPANTPDVDGGGAPVGPQTPDSASTSMDSDSAATGQSPPPRGKNGMPVLFLIGLAVVLLLVAAGGIGFALSVG